jgi:hypothetical protein
MPEAKTAAEKESAPTKEGEEKVAEKKIGGEHDLIILDDQGQAAEAVERKNKGDVAPFRLEHEGAVYERAGTDADGRPTYRKSV